jgi:hypothetical protein
VLLDETNLVGPDPILVPRHFHVMSDSICVKRVSPAVPAKSGKRLGSFGAGAPTGSAAESGSRPPDAIRIVIRPSAVYVAKPLGLSPNNLRLSPPNVLSGAETSFQVPMMVLLRAIFQCSRFPLLPLWPSVPLTRPPKSVCYPRGTVAVI